MARWLLLPRILLFLDTLRPRDIEGSEGVAAFGFWFLRTIVALMRETASVSFRTLAFFFPLVTHTVSSFNATQSLTILDHCCSFNSPVSGVKVSLSQFLIYTPLDHCLQFLINGHRYLLMNLMSYNSNPVLSCADSRILNLYRLSKI